VDNYQTPKPLLGREIKLVVGEDRSEVVITGIEVYGEPVKDEEAEPKGNVELGDQ
jgi:hypothetical protein